MSELDYLDQGGIIFSQASQTAHLPCTPSQYAIHPRIVQFIIHMEHNRATFQNIVSLQGKSEHIQLVHMLSVLSVSGGINYENGFWCQKTPVAFMQFRVGYHMMPTWSLHASYGIRVGFSNHNQISSFAGISLASFFGPTTGELLIRPTTKTNSTGHNFIVIWYVKKQNNNVIFFVSAKSDKTSFWWSSYRITGTLRPYIAKDVHAANLSASVVGFGMPQCANWPFAVVSCIL